MSTENAVNSIIEKYGKIVGFVLAAILVVVIAFVSYQRFYSQPREDKAFLEMTEAEKYFQKDSIAKSLKGEKGVFYGFEEITEKYKGTKAANLSKYYVGIGLFKEGKYKESIESLESFKTSEPSIDAMRTGVIGDAYVQLKQYDKALEYFGKATEIDPENEVIFSLFHKKAGVVAYQLEKKDVALEHFEAINEKFPESIFKADVEKYIGLLSSH